MNCLRMKSWFRYSLIGILIALFFASCYRDKGNYSYKDLNELTINLPEVVSVQQGMVVNVTPELEFALGDEEGDLSYEWVITTSTGRDSIYVVLSTERKLEKRIDYAAGNSYPLNFKVTDNNTGVTYRKETKLRVLTEFQPGYFLLEEKEGRGDISFYNTERDSAYYDIFSKANPDIVLKPNVNNLFSLDYNGYQIQIGDEIQNVAAGNLSVVFGEDWGYVIDYRSLRVISGVEQLFADKPEVIRPQVLAKSPNFYFMNDGKIYRMYQTQGQTSFGLAYITPDGGDYDCSFFGTGANNGWGVVCFDCLNHCLYELTDNNINLNYAYWPYVDATTGDTIINPAKMNENWDLMAMAHGGMNNGAYFMIFKDSDPERIHVVKYDANGQGFRRGPIATVGDDEYLRMMSSTDFLLPYRREQLYYTHDNEIRLYNITSNSSQVIHAFPAGEEVTTMVFHDKDGSKLAVATHDGNEGRLYTFDVADTGYFKSATPIVSEKGFGYIKKIVQRQ